MWIAWLYDIGLKIPWPPGQRSVTSGGEFMPVEAEVHDQ
ncbi:hypothetical protein HDF14_002916 [Edaphobacter lichenicola]|uniref:Uncharacterized protein n=1 Tax=Tunturiibacter gelidiferens TaxID=3069689 RepID=A0A9X0QF94_9BACT|nr:hypothetical protein [Edaphobacter lichenicola]